MTAPSLFRKTQLLASSAAVFVALWGMSPAPAQAVGLHRLEQLQNKDHELTEAEVQKLDLAEAKIKYQERKDRLENGGKLTKEERERLNRELKRLSKRIHEEEEKK